MNYLKILIQWVRKYPYEIAFVLASAATIGSLILSNVLGFIPCDLCWYQRILMFPLPLILGVAVLRKDDRAFLYVLPLASIGALIALYQSLLQWGIIKENFVSCSLTSVSCAKSQINLLGFMTIPFGALASFLLIVALMLIARSKTKSKTSFDTTQQQLMSKLLIGLLVATVAAVFLIQLNR